MMHEEIKAPIVAPVAISTIQLKLGGAWMMA
jgi:hypothetical protein